jgi:predicted MFS family arabinose efflux permease
MLLSGDAIGGLSLNYSMLLAIRMIEGLASGVLQPSSAIVILRLFGSGAPGMSLKTIIGQPVETRIGLFQQ